MDLSCWMDIEQLRKLDPKLPDEADTKAREIKQKYFNKKYFFGPNSPATREGLDNVSLSSILCFVLNIGFVKNNADSHRRYKTE